MLEAVKLVLEAGPWALLLLVVFAVAYYPEKTEKVSGYVLGLFSWASKRLRRRSVKSTLQGQINTFARQMDGEVKGSMPYNIRLDFVTEVDRAELDPTKQTVIVRIRDRMDDDRNLVGSMLVFCSIGVIPQPRRYLSPAMNEAIDITMTRKLLNSLRHYSGLQYLDGDVMPECVKATPGLSEMCATFDRLDESGFFTRVIIEELRDFGAQIETRIPAQSHASEAGAFVQYVYEVATKQPGENMPEIGHRGRYIATAFMFVGASDTMRGYGETPYLNHLRRLSAAGFRKVYLAARGGTREWPESLSVDMAESVTSLAERGGLGKRGRTMEYYTGDAAGSTRRCILIEMTLVPSANGDVAQGVLFSDFEEKQGS